MDHLERVFAFDDPVEFLNFELRERKKSNAQFSLRAWSRRVGYKNPSYLSHVLSRKRRLKPEFAGKLANDLALKGRSLKYFELIVLNQNAGTESEQETYRKLISATRAKRPGAANQVSLETFSLVADWYHWAIIEMANLGGFDSDPKAIQKNLVAKVDLKTIKDAIQRLLRAGLLTRDGSGNLIRANRDKDNETHAPAQPEAVVAYHKQMGSLGLRALVEQPAEERTFYGTTLTFRKDSMKRAQEILKEAHLQLLRCSEQGGAGEDVYQLNTQFFRLAGKPRHRAQKK